MTVSGVCGTEGMGFEPTHRLTGLTHFECAPLNRLGNPPDAADLLAICVMAAAAKAIIFHQRQFLQVQICGVPLANNAII